MAAVDDAGVNAIVRQAEAGIRVGELGQTLEIRNLPIMDDTNAQFIANSIRERAPGTVAVLDLAFLEFSQEAAEVLRELFAQKQTSTAATTLRKIMLEGPIGNANGVLLLSGLHHHPYVTELRLVRVGFEGVVGGAILSTLLRNNSRLNELHCVGLPLGLSGARALQPALRLNQTVHTLHLRNCNLGDDGLSVIVNALGENATITILLLSRNGFTSNGLPHVTRLLQRDSLRILCLGFNRRVFDNEENTRDFSSALSKTTKMTELGLINCHLPVHAFTVLFQAIANMTTLQILGAYDTAQVQGQSLECLLNIIPQMHLVYLLVNLDFTDESVLSCFHRNMTVQDLYAPGIPLVEITTGPIYIILERNRRLYRANELLAREPQRTVSFGVWVYGVHRLARDSTGATATYKILREKLVHWWGPTGPTAAPAPGTSYSSSSTTNSTVSISTGKRSLMQRDATACNDDNNNDDDEQRRRRHARHLAIIARSGTIVSRRYDDFRSRWV